MQVTGTHFNYFQVCHRKLWLFSHGIQMEHDSALVAEGRLIHDYAYPHRAAKYSEIELDGIKIDYYDAKNKVVHEVKKSNKVEEANVWQLKYYLYILKHMGIESVSGILEYPRLRRKEEVLLSQEDIEYLEECRKNIVEIVERENMPPRIPKKLCKSCSYFDFCWVDEE